MKQATLKDFLEPPEIRRAIELRNLHNTGLARVICEELIKPNIDRINRALGQENDPMYIAYAVEYAINATAVQPSIYKHK